MKKYIKLSAGDRVMKGDEFLHSSDGSGEWKDMSHEEGYIVTSRDEGYVRRPVPHAGDVQFLMAVSILVPVIVNCDGREQESIEAEAGELAYQKVLDDPRKYINYESIDWAACKVDEIQPEPKNTGKYRYLEPGEIIQAGDHMKDREAFHWQYCTAYIGCEILPKEPYQFRRPITEPQYPVGCEKENGYGESKDGGKTGLWMVFDKGQQSGDDANSIHPKHYFMPRVERIDEPTDQEPLESDSIAWELARLAGYDLDANGYVCGFPISHA